MDDTLLKFFIAVTTVAVVVQAGILVGLYLSLRKSSAKIEALADEVLNRTMDRVEETSEVVHKTVLSPLRQVNGLMSAISTGVEVFLGQKRRHPKNGGGVPQDEMFI